MPSTPNTLTNLVPELYNGLDTVSRELVGFIPAVSSDMTFERAAKGQTVRSPVVPASAATDITPDVTPPDDGNQTITTVSMTIDKARRVPVRWNGEERLSLDKNGNSYNVILANQFAQAYRTLTNEIEADIAALHKKASRAAGVYSAEPFASTLTDPAQARKIMADNGAPMSDLQMVINTSAGANMRTLAQLNKLNESAGEPMLRRGVLLDLHGFAIRESAAVASFTAGAMANATTASGTLTVGQTVLPLATAGTGLVAAGDIITIANDTNQYVIASVTFASTAPASGDSITIAAPGIRLAQGTAARAITVIASSGRNMFFDRGAIALATRAPALPDQGDSAADRMIVTDDISGLSFEISMYLQYRQVQYEVAIAWGCQMIKPAHCGILLGKP